MIVLFKWKQNGEVPERPYNRYFYTLRVYTVYILRSTAIYGVCRRILQWNAVQKL